jgi:hypothetical protein
LQESPLNDFDSSFSRPINCALFHLHGFSYSNFISGLWVFLQPDKSIDPAHPARRFPLK